jgi:hypothetical protein
MSTNLRAQFNSLLPFNSTAGCPGHSRPAVTLAAPYTGKSAKLLPHVLDYQQSAFCQRICALHSIFSRCRDIFFALPRHGDAGMSPGDRLRDAENNTSWWIKTSHFYGIRPFCGCPLPVAMAATAAVRGQFALEASAVVVPNYVGFATVTPP